MGLSVNLRLLRERSETLEGELAAEEWAADFHDELVVFASPLRYRIEAELQGENLFLQGPLSITLDCTCGRCLKTFRTTVTSAEFAAFVPLEGEDALTCVGDFGDLTPLLREDMYLTLPTNPVCNPECRGLARTVQSQEKSSGNGSNDAPSPWAALDQLSL
jgi:uncharacterized protein